MENLGAGGRFRLGGPWQARGGRSLPSVSCARLAAFCGPARVCQASQPDTNKGHPLASAPTPGEGAGPCSCRVSRRCATALGPKARSDVLCPAFVLCDLLRQRHVVLAGGAAPLCDLRQLLPGPRRIADLQIGLAEV